MKKAAFSAESKQGQPPSLSTKVALGKNESCIAISYHFLWFK